MLMSKVENGSSVYNWNIINHSVKFVIIMTRNKINGRMFFQLQSTFSLGILTFCILTQNLEPT